MIFVPVLTPEASATSNTPELRGGGEVSLSVSADKARVAPGLEQKGSQSLAASEPSCNPLPRGQWCWGWGGEWEDEYNLGTSSGLGLQFSFQLLINA